MSRIISFLNLAYRFNVHMLKKPVSSARGAARERFLQNYADDRLAPLSPQQRQALSRFSRCVCCGLCDTVCQNLPTSRRHLFNGPSDLAGCHTRSLPDYHLLGPSLDNWHTCDRCTHCEDVCPSGVPLRDLARLVTEIMAAQEDAQE